MSSKLQSKAHSEGTILGFFHRQFTKPKPLPKDIQLTDQVAIITGSNTGLGLETSRQLLQLGLSHLVMGVRSQAKGDTAANLLRKEFSQATISVWLLDLESYDSITAFAERCATLPRIDIAILNAGLSKTSFSTVASTGHENLMQVNYLSTALLAILLLPILKAKKSASATRPPVLSMVGSDLAYMGTIETNGPILQQFDQAKGFIGMSWYSKSKLVLTLFTAKLAEFTSSSDVLINIVNPGMTKGTDLGREAPWMLGIVLRPIQALLARSVEVGATTYVDAVLGQGEESHGSFLSEWTIKPYPEIWYTEDGKKVSERLWEETMEEFNFAGASKILDGLKNGQ